MAGGEQLVYEGLGGVAGGGGEDLFGGVCGEWVGVVGEEVAEVEGEGRGRVYSDRSVVYLLVGVWEEETVGDVQSAGNSRICDRHCAVAHVHGAAVDPFGELRVCGRCYVERDAAVHFGV